MTLASTIVHAESVYGLLIYALLIVTAFVGSHNKTLRVRYRKTMMR